MIKKVDEIKIELDSQYTNKFEKYSKELRNKYEIELNDKNNELTKYKESNNPNLMEEKINEARAEERSLAFIEFKKEIKKLELEYNNKIQDMNKNYNIQREKDIQDIYNDIRNK